MNSSSRGKNCSPTAEVSGTAYALASGNFRRQPVLLGGHRLVSHSDPDELDQAQLALACAGAAMALVAAPATAQTTATPAPYVRGRGDRRSRGRWHEGRRASLRDLGAQRDRHARARLRRAFRRAQLDRARVGRASRPGTAGQPGGWRADQWSFLGRPGGIRVVPAWEGLIAAGAPGGIGTRWRS